MEHSIHEASWLLPKQASMKERSKLKQIKMLTIPNMVKVLTCLNAPQTQNNTKVRATRYVLIV